jgi:hypothetical protein
MARIDNFLRDIKDIQRRLHNLETVKQPLGGDVVQVATSNVASTTLTVDSGEIETFSIDVSLDTPKNTLYNVFFSVYVDTNNNANYLYPYGSSLSAGQKALIFTHWDDQRYANMTTGARRYAVEFINYDSVTHIYYVYVQVANISIGFA